MGTFRRGLIIWMVLMAISIQLQAQDYKYSVGFRGGYTTAFTFKYFFSDEDAAGGFLSFRKGGVQFGILKEFSQPVLSVISRELSFYYGFGGHFGMVRTNYNYYLFDKYYFPERKSSGVIGVDMCVGIEYLVPGIPLALSLDAKPFFEVIMRGTPRFHIWDFGISAMYIF